MQEKITRHCCPNCASMNRTMLLPFGVDYCPGCGCDVSKMVPTRKSEEMTKKALAAIRLEEARVQREKDKRWDELCDAARKERKEKDKKIESVCLIGNNNKKSAIAAAGRGIIGGALLGPVGALAGIASTGGKETATFSIKYKSGRIATETVPVNSYRFRELAAYLHE